MYMDAANKDNVELTTIPNKRYFSIGEVARLCAIKPHVLRYWEQVFPMVKPQRRGNRRYYRYPDVLCLRQIRGLLYDQGYTINGARQKITATATAQADGESSEYQDVIRDMIDDLKQLLKRLRM